MAALLKESYQSISKRKCEARDAAIPPDWRLKSLPDDSVTNVLDIPRTCGILSDQEIHITEDYDATALAQAIRDGKFKVLDVTIAYCKRAAIAQQLVNCITEPMFNHALHRAAWLDNHRSAWGSELPPLFGLPISVKDQFRITGVDASMGLANLCFKPSSTTSPLIRILLAQGAVILCKTNMPQTGMALDSVNNIFGRTLNPLNKHVTAGGSSGGEGAIVAIKGSVLGVGTDIGGSIRIPAFNNGLYGFKSSAARVPYGDIENAARQPGGGAMALEPSAGPIARSLRDCELFLHAVSNARPWTYDPSVIPGLWEHTDLSARAVPSPFSQPNPSPPSKPLTIGVLYSDGLVPPLPPVAATLSRVAASLQKAGHTVVTITPPPSLAKAQSLANALFTIEGGNDMYEHLTAYDEPMIPWLAAHGGPKPRQKHAKDFLQIRDLHAQRIALAAELNESLWTAPAPGRPAAELDAFICPIAGHPVAPLDSWAGVGYTADWVLLDYAAGVVPVGKMSREDLQLEIDEKVVGPAKDANRWDRINRALWDRGNEKVGRDRQVYLGTPLAVQVVAPRLQELRCYRAMQAVDEACNGKAGFSYATTKASAKL